ncbi:MAG: cysteine desulfurase family protein [Treponema sp.]
MIYLDWAATAKPNEKLILNACKESYLYFANPSSIHAEGRKVSELKEKLRCNIASLLGANSKDIFFTSGGTEANQIIITSLLNHPFKNEILTLEGEHASSSQMFKSMKEIGYKINTLSTHKGFITPEEVLKKITEKTALVSIMLVNNETGLIQPIKEIATALKTKMPDIHFHSDMVQALGKIQINLTELAVDSASFSAHKIGAMRGVGILYLKKKVKPFLLGGGQEAGFRAGTENIAGIISLEKCLNECSILMEKQLEKARELSDFLIKKLKKIDGVEFLPNAREEKRLKFSPYIISFYNHYIRGEVLVRMMSDKNIAISSGSACSANSKNKNTFSFILPKYRENVVRVSIGYSSTKEELIYFIDTLKEIIGGLQWK